MQINIDTSHDSTDDIKKVISFLQHFIEEGKEPEIPEASEGIFNLFNDDSPSLSTNDSDNSDDDIITNAIPDEPLDDEEVKIIPYDDF